MPCSLPSALHQLEQAVRAAGEERVGSAARRSSCAGSPRRSRPRWCRRYRAPPMTVPTLLEQIGRHHEFRAAGAEDRGDADAVARRRAGRSAPCVARPTPRPSTTMCFQLGRRVKPTPSGPTMLRSSPGLSVASPRVPRPDAFVEELDAAALAIDAVDALRPAQPQLAVVGRRAEQVEELPRLDRQRLGRSVDHEVLVFGVDPVVRDDRAERFLGRNVPVGRRRGRAACPPRRGRCERPMRIMRIPGALTLPVSPAAVPKSIFFPNFEQTDEIAISYYL